MVAGDGVGPEVIGRGPRGPRAGRRSRRSSNYELVRFDLGGERYLRTGEVLPDDEIERLLAAAMPSCWVQSGIPAFRRGSSRKGFCCGFGSTSSSTSTCGRFSFIRAWKARSAAKGPTTSTWSSCARTTKTCTSVPGDSPAKGTPEEVAIQTSINTRAGVERHDPLCLRSGSPPRRARAPFRGLSAADRGQGLMRQVTLVAKTNVLTFAHDLWMRAFTEVSGEYPEIKSDYQHVDACCMRMVANPERFDVIVTTNMFGDIITDLGAVLQGGMGLAASGNLNPDGRLPACSSRCTARRPTSPARGWPTRWRRSSRWR